MLLVASIGAYGAAIIAGAAAILGGAVTAGSNLAVEGLRRRQQREAEAERDQRELRQATRLILAELAEIRQAIKHSATSHLTWTLDRQLPSIAWREYRAILATHLPLHAWRWVEGAYNEANGLNWRVAEMCGEFHNSNGPIHFIENEWLRRPFETLYHAMSGLELTLGEPRGSFGYTGYATLAELEEGIWSPPPSDPDEETSTTA